MRGLSRNGEHHWEVSRGGRGKLRCRFWGVCEETGEREGVMLTLSCSLQTGDPGLETGHLRLLREDKGTQFRQSCRLQGPKASIKTTRSKRTKKSVGFNSPPAEMLLHYSHNHSIHTGSHLDEQRLVGRLHGFLRRLELSLELAGLDSGLI